MAADSLSTTYTGRVVSVNDRGLRLDGHPDWYNCSKFAPPIVLPERGETVTVTVDSKGFLRSCETVSGVSPTNGAYAPVRSATGQQTASGGTRDQTITRLAVLKAAAEFAAGRHDVKSGDVLLIAASWERWVTRDDTAPDELDEAF
jgi:hypothetical protein